MKAPKILPWIARRTAISDELALSLWRRAASEAEALSGDSNSGNYFHTALDRFIELCQDEGENLGGSTSFGKQLHWIQRYQNRVVHINLMAARKTWQLCIANWNSLLNRQSEATRTP